MPNIIRINNYENETNLEGLIIPVDSSDYAEIGKQIDTGQLKEWILSGYTDSFTGTTSGTSGINGVNGTSGMLLYNVYPSNTIRIRYYLTTTVLPITTTTTTSVV